MEIYTSLVEDIAYCDDREKLAKVARDILNNFEFISRTFSNDVNFEEKMRTLYSLKSEIGLTKITESTKHYFLDKQKSEKYGIEVLDFSNKDYILYAHAASSRETIEDLITGKDSEMSNFISLSPISLPQSSLLW